MSGDSAIFNLDFIDPFGIPLYDVILKAKTSGAVHSVVLNQIEGEPQYLTTFQNSVQFENPTGTIEYYGRVESDTLVATQSFKNATNGFPPLVDLYAELAPDAVGDTTPGSAGQWLDLTGSAVTFSDTRFYARLNNAGGGWPQSEGFSTYFIYGFIIANPDSLTLAALALIYANVPIIIPSGLYHVDLTDTSFSRISGISTNTSGNSLHLGCNISDITSDPLFPTWPPASGFIITGGFTLTVEFSEPGFNDYTYPSLFIPQTQYLETAGNSAPLLGDIAFDIVPNITVNAAIDYHDSEDNLPVLRQLFFDGDVFNLGSFDHSYNDTARFTHLLTWPGAGEHYYYFRFSDGGDTVQTALDTLLIDPNSTPEHEIPLTFELYDNYPNPFNAQTTISFSLDRQAELTLNIYDITGKAVRTLANGNFGPGFHQASWEGKNNDGHLVSSGIYFYRLDISGKGSVTRKMLLLK
jgi:hypothetical protein